MEKIKSSADVASHLAESEKVAALNLNGAEKSIGRVMTAWPNDRGLYTQLKKLSAFITKTREDISALRPTEMKENFIPKATDELDAIVEATASATNRIMDAADVIMDLAGKMPASDASKATAAVTSIYEACTFQDITGQRVTKIIGVLKLIEDRIDKMLAAVADVESSANSAISTSQKPPGIGDNGASQAEHDAPFGEADPVAERKRLDARLLNGPALAGEGTTQDEIDALFSNKE